jgi:syntaxin 16
VPAFLLHPSELSFTVGYVYVELQGHGIKNKDVLIASGTMPMTTSERISEMDDDIRAVRIIPLPFWTLDNILTPRTYISPQSRSQLSAQQQGQMQEPDLETRTRELNGIAKSITQLAEVFKDLQAMVIDQGTILDSVEYNIEQTAVHVQEAVKELKIATQYV